MRRVVPCLLVVAMAFVAPQANDVQLVLSDGRVLTGTDVWREQGNYYLVVEGGGVIPIPEPLVERVALSAVGTPEPESASVSPEAGPSGMRNSGPEQLAGPSVAAPRPSEQLAAFGEPAQFQRNVVDSEWHPTSDWNADASDPHRNDFAPSTWSESIVDSEWHPTSAFQEDHTQFAPSTWQPGVVDSSWTPQDGFKKS